MRQNPELYEDRKELNRQSRETTYGQMELKTLVEDLKKRTRELDILFAISRRRKIASSLNQIMRDTVDLLPLAWENPEDTCARITIGEHVCCTANFRETSFRQEAPIISHGTRIGTVEAFCLGPDPDGFKDRARNTEHELLKAIAESLSRATERKWVEESLRLSEENFFKAFQSCPALAAITSLPEGRFMEVNQSFAQSFGFEAEEIIGQSIERLGLLSTAKGRPGLDALFNGPGGFKEEKVTVGGESGFPHTVLWSAEPIEFGKERCLINILIDITEQEQAHVDLKKSEIRYRELFNHMSSGVAVFERKAAGEEYILTDINKAGEKIVKVKKELVAGKTTLQQLPGFGEPEFQKVFQQVQQTGEAQYHPVYSYVNGRVAYWADNYIYKLPTGEMVVVYDDISELKRAEEEASSLEARLRQTQKMEAMGTLAGGIAHDFNNILQAILGYAELALLKLSQTSPPRQYINQILKAALRARNLIKQILAFSREAEQEFKPIKIEPVLEEALSLIRASLPTTVEIRQQIPLGTGDRQGGCHPDTPDTDEFVHQRRACHAGKRWVAGDRPLSG